ncbi:DUF1592 domain-containing protein, partial [Akkermansiaceae bacterium]|nr:DUF1592 domain-containing protein [Akkermansiaceae bacterium]
MELGLGPEDQHGRTVLSANEMAFAMAFALTDDPPDEALWSAARNGHLKSRDEIRFQVERLLDDTTIAKPK